MGQIGWHAYEVNDRVRGKAVWEPRQTNHALIRGVSLVDKLIRIEGVRKSYDLGKSFVVDSIHLDIERGELMVLLGESGCGKTTTLKMINRLIEPTTGTIHIDNQDTQKLNPVDLRRRIGYVIQNVGLFPHMTVCENMAVVPELLGWPQTKIHTRTNELFDLIGMPPEAYSFRYPRELSGGQQQRIGLARALAAKPRIMLMDEPFGALDPLTRDDLREEYLKIHRKLELTTIMVTHDITEALLLADRIAVIAAGRILCVGTPHTLLRQPGDAYVERLMEMPKRQADRVEMLLGKTGGAST